MTISLTPEQEAQLQRFINAGHYASPEQFIEVTLTSAYAETDAFAKVARAKLAALQKDIEEGRVVTIPHGQLTNVIAKRNQNPS